MTDYPALAAGIRTAQEEVKEVNVANGWFDSSRSFGDDIALLHSEVTEAFEAYRKGDMELMFPAVEYVDTTYGERFQKIVVDPAVINPSSMPAELADVFIRLLDTCERYNIDLVEAFEQKLAYNRNRAYRHGGKRV